MYGQEYKCVPRWFGWESIHCELKMDNVLSLDDVLKKKFNE